MSATTIAVKTRDLRKEFGEGATRVQALRGVDFEGRQLRKGATDAIIKFVIEKGGDVPSYFKEMSDKISRNGGTASRQTGLANRQRGAKRQPGGGASRLGTTPAMASSRALRAAARSMRGIERMRP